MPLTKEYVESFVHAYRNKVEELFQRKPNAVHLYPSEYIFEKPCQVEIFELSAPPEYLWIILFDKDKPDLNVRIHKTGLGNLRHHMYILAENYPKLDISPSRLTKIIDTFQDVVGEYYKYARQTFAISCEKKNVDPVGSSERAEFIRVILLYILQSVDNNTSPHRLTMDNSAQNAADSLFSVTFTRMGSTTYKFRSDCRV